MRRILVNGWQDGGITYDTDAQNYMDRVEAHGVSLTGTQKNAIDAFFVGAKSNGLYTNALLDGGLLIFANAAANAEKFKGGTDITWNGTVTHASTGVTSDGSTGYGNLNIIANTLTLNNSRISVYNNTNTASASAVDMGCSFSTTSRIQMFLKTTTSGIFDHNSTTGGAGRLTINSIGDVSGYMISSRTSSTLLKAYRNGTPYATTATTTNNGTFPNLNIYLLATNPNGAASGFSPRELKYWDVGEGLNDANAAIWSTLVANLLSAF